MAELSRTGLLALLDQVASGTLSPQNALDELADWPFATVLGPEATLARVDTLRLARTGVPEVVLAEGKELDELLPIVARLHQAHGRVLITRAAPTAAKALGTLGLPFRYNRRARCVVVGASVLDRIGQILVVGAGTSDRNVVEEVIETARFCGSRADFVLDVGVAGLHRVLAVLPDIARARVVVVTAGMEGTLPGIIAGLTRQPVIGVPVSRGYGVGKGGRTALRTMLSSCAPGLAVVNVDNGFGAGVLAHRINTLPNPPVDAS